MLNKALTLLVILAFGCPARVSAVDLPESVSEQIEWFNAEIYNSDMTVNAIPPAPAFWHVRAWEGSWNHHPLSSMTTSVSRGSVSITNDHGIHSHSYVTFNQVLGERFGLQITLTEAYQLVFTAVDGADRNIHVNLPAGDAVKTITVVRDQAEWFVLLDREPIAYGIYNLDPAERVGFGIALVSGATTTVHDFRVSFPADRPSE